MNNNSKKILSYILVLASLFIIVLFTKDLIFDLQSNLDLKDSKIKKIQEKREEHKKLKQTQEKLKKQADSEVEKYLNKPTEDEIVDYIYSMIENGNLGKEVLWKKIPSVYGQAEIKSLSITKAKKNELWFLESDITLNISVEKENRLKSILDSFVSSESKYKFFIDSFSYEKPEYKLTSLNTIETQSIEVIIPLKIFYK